MAASPEAGAQTNPLLGDWTLTEGGPSCYVKMEFALGTQTRIDITGTPNVSEVAYSTGKPGEVYVIDGDGPIGYRILGPDRIRLDSAVSCVWRRG